MRAREFINEGGVKKMHRSHKAAMSNTVTYPDQNMSTGSAYKNYRFGLALAGAPDFPMASEPWVGGDPLLSPYTEAEMEIINFAANEVGSKGKRKWTNSRSEELADTNKLSPTPDRKKLAK